MNYLPGGAESDFDSDDDFYGFNAYGNKPKFLPAEIVKSPLELKKENLLLNLKNNKLDGIKEELDHGQCKEFDIDEKLDDRWNLLYHACDLALPEIVEYLISERGVNIYTSEGGENPLMIACCSHANSLEVLKVVKILIKQNVNFRASNEYGVTPMMVACSKGHVEVVKYLLSLNDSFDAIDNEGRNALFHAIEGNQVEIAKILIEAGIDLNVVNKFGESAKDAASDDNNEKILELFPPEIYRYVPPTNFVSYNRFEDLIPGMSTDVPTYFPDVVKMLRGMNCEKFIMNFAQAKVSLEEFLTISDERLKEIGIEFPFERKIILLGLHNFHNAEWTRQSIFVPKDLKQEDLTPLDLVMILANVLHQLIIIQTQFIYMKKLGANFDLNETYGYIKLDRLIELKKKVKTLEKMTRQTIARSVLTKPLLITNKNPKKKNLTKFAVAASVLAIPVIVMFKHLIKF